jgi:hypothetical protein
MRSVVEEYSYGGAYFKTLSAACLPGRGPVMRSRNRSQKKGSGRGIMKRFWEEFLR